MRGGNVRDVSGVASNGIRARREGKELEPRAGGGKRSSLLSPINESLIAPPGVLLEMEFDLRIITRLHMVGTGTHCAPVQKANEVGALAQFVLLGNLGHYGTPVTPARSECCKAGRD
ncbi:hypothetical protein MHYP_G00298070 [Metynnis hypsauchen]